MQSKLKNETRIEKVIIENNFINLYTIFPKAAHFKLRSKKSSKKPSKSESSSIPSIPKPTESSSIPELPPIPTIPEPPPIPDVTELPPTPDVIEFPPTLDVTELPPTPDVTELPPTPDLFGMSDQSIQQTKLRIEVVRPSEDEEVFALYCKFQSIILHDDDKEMESFMNFLGIDFLDEPGENEGLFWIKWYFDNKLFAVSVLDIYPTVVVGTNHFVYL